MVNGFINVYKMPIFLDFGGFFVQERERLRLSYVLNANQDKSNEIATSRPI